MSYTCDKCGKYFETPIMVESGGVYSDMPHKEPASPCCKDSFTETIQEYFNEGTPFQSMANQPALSKGDDISCPTCYECGKLVSSNDVVYDGDVIFHQDCFEKCFIEK